MTRINLESKNALWENFFPQCYPCIEFLKEGCVFFNALENKYFTDKQHFIQNSLLNCIIKH